MLLFHKTRDARSKMNYHPHIHVIVLDGSAARCRNHNDFKQLINSYYDKEWLLYEKNKVPIKIQKKHPITLHNRVQIYMTFLIVWRLVTFIFFFQITHPIT